jgi:hypothetical protein
MLFNLLLEFLGDLTLTVVGVTAVGVVGLDSSMPSTADPDILCKNYSNEAIIWSWGDNPDMFNFQDFIGLTKDEVKKLIPDVKNKEYSLIRMLDNYELDLSFNDQDICIQAEYMRPDDPNWPYKYNGKFPLDHTYTESKVMQLISKTKYPIYIYKRVSLLNWNSVICEAYIDFSEVKKINGQGE